MDFIEGLPKSEGKDVILVVVDRFTEHGHLLIPSHPFTDVQEAKLFPQQIYNLHVLPSRIVSDMDKSFTGQFWKGYSTLS